MTHTPGPWRVDYAMGIRGADSTPIAYIMSDSSNFPTPDAQLIAAAPELLDALLETLAEMESLIKSRNIFCDGGINISNRAREAIAKATGEK